MTITSLSVATRSSPLALTQVDEVRRLVTPLLPTLQWEIFPFVTTGDRDLTISLRTLGATNFFTYELDEAVLSGRCRLAIHAAKDLPQPLPAGLSIIALTQGLSNADSVVTASGTSLYNLPSGACIATSSLRREEAVKALRPDLSFCDLRGTIHQRLSLLDQGHVQGVVVAEAALLRLNLTHKPRLRLPGPTTPLQGRLALVARSDDTALADLLGFLHVADSPSTLRQLHVGITHLPPSPYAITHHCPLITTTPLPYHDEEITACLQQIALYTHCIFTSQHAVHYLMEALHYHNLSPSALQNRVCIAVGNTTANALRQYGISTLLIATEATAEGICSLLSSLDLTQAFLFWPHAALARSVITDYFTTHKRRWNACTLYNTSPYCPPSLPSLTDYDEIFFTSPSSLDAFLHLYGTLPSTSHALLCHGPITRARLRQLLN